ncbi:carboxyl transferase domain-containing protein [Brevibacterium aurantiacum]|uniref:carboxyl transferase domain-containing protein n=1 Tax=Brevibacterium aurantiacum TaxID=273384 RepID=UPI001866706B|nr:carboxyl transferase domain-containing protein [Brevibacterium aurantiacum]
MTQRHIAADPMVIDELSRRHQDILDANRPEAVAKQHSRGQLTARERIEELLDAGETLWESGPLAVPVGTGLTAPADGLVIGIGRVHSRPCVIVSCDYTSLGGSLGITSHAKLTRAMFLAVRYELPVFVLVEGGGARVQEYQSLPSVRPAEAFGTMARLSGRVPMIGLALGRAFAGHAILLGECDTVIATETAALGIAGPPLVKAATGMDLTPEEIGGSQIHSQAGGVERLVRNDREAILEARLYSAYFFHRRNEPSYPQQLSVEDQSLAVGQDDVVNVRQAVESVVDQGSLFELRSAWATGATTAFGRIGGRAVGVIAVGPDEGESILGLTRDHCDKIARFQSLCQSFGIPDLRIIGSVRPADDDEGSEDALFRHASRLIQADDANDSMSITVLVGELVGVTQTVLGGFSRFLNGPFHFMWPNATLQGLGAGENGTSAYGVAEAFSTDDVIDPGSTRQTIVDVLNLLDQESAGTGTPVHVW